MDSAWLKATLRSRKITQRSLGEAVGLSQDKINKALAHVRLFSPIEAIKIADFLEKHHVSRSETLRAIIGKDAALLEGRVSERRDISCNVMPSPFLEKRISIIGTVESGGVVHYCAAGALQEFADPVGLGNIDSLVALHVAQESGLSPAYRSGDVLYYDDHGNIDQSAIGKEVVAELRDGRRFLRILSRGTMPGSHTLEAIAQTGALDNILLKSASRILWIKKS